jgi:hypothetical protein
MPSPPRCITRSCRQNQSLDVRLQARRALDKKFYCCPLAPRRIRATCLTFSAILDGFRKRPYPGWGTSASEVLRGEAITVHALPDRFPHAAKK